MPLLLLACATVAGCGRGPASGANTTAQNASDPEQVLGERWRRMFDDPSAVIRAANEFGYRATPWATGPEGFGTTGVEQVLPDAKSSVKVRTRFAATGSAHRVDGIEFQFEIAKDGPATTRKERDAANIPRRVVNGFLSRFDLGPGDDVRRAMIAANSVNAARHGGHIVVEGRRVADGTRALIILRLTRR